MNIKNHSGIKSRIIGAALSLAISAGMILPLGAAAESSKKLDTAGVFPTAVTQGGIEEMSLSRLEYKLPGITTRRISAVSKRSILLNGSRVAQGFMMNDTIYLPAEALARALGGVKSSYNASTKTLTISMNGLYLTATDVGFVTYANDRALFAFSPNVVMDDGNMYIPASTLIKAFGLKSSINGTRVSLTGKFTPLLHASKYYRDDEVYWLSKIIRAEAGGESLIGQIAVGDVILNRVKSSLYPSTIYGVIFDTRYGVQFSPILDGSIYKDPTFTSTLAAKICLEGASLSDNALFFLNPRTAASSWIVKSCEYAYTIGGHDFYL